MTYKSLSSVLSICACSAVALLLAGCSANFQPSPVADENPSQTQTGVIRGAVHGGQAPVSNSKIFLFETGTGGYGSASKSLITSGAAGCITNGQSDAGRTFAGLNTANGASGKVCYVLTDNNGNFALSGDYTCDTGRQVYMVSMSGNPGLAPVTTQTPVTVTATATFSNNSNTITVSNVSGTIVVGATVTANAGIASGTTVTKVNGTTVTLNKQTTARERFGETVTFTTTTTTTTPANNPYIVQMAGLGECPAQHNLAAQDPFVNLNEISTVVFAYTMAPFGSDAFDIGTDAGGTTAIQHAMANAMNIYNLATGGAYSTTHAAGSSGTIPTDKIYALADILAQCVNTSGNLASGQSCRSLFSDTNQTVTGGNGTNATSTSDEAQAIFYIAHNPTANVQALYNVLPNTPVFSESLAQPADWALPIVYKSAVGTPGNIAFDSTGNAWISDKSSSSGGVVKITPTGVLTKFGNLNNGGSNGSIYQVAVNTDDNVWAVDYSNNQVYRLNPSGGWESSLTGTGNNQLQNPVSIAFTSSGNALVLNASSNYISKFSSSGAGQTAATYNQNGFGGGSLGAPIAIAVDGGNNAFIPENVGCQCMGVLPNGSSVTTAYDDYSGNMGNASAIAVDASNNPWHVQPSGNEITEDPSASTSATNGGYQDANVQALLNSFTGYYFNVNAQNCILFVCPTAVNPTPVTGGGLNKPISLAFDGSGYMWAGNSGAMTISGFNGATSLTSTTGIQTQSPAAATGGVSGAAPDLAGNLWTVNSDGSVSEILGLATPTATPVYPGHVSVKP